MYRLSDRGNLKICLSQYAGFVAPQMFNVREYTTSDSSQKTSECRDDTSEATRPVVCGTLDEDSQIKGQKACC